MKRIKDEYVLSTGKAFYANRGLISLGRARDPGGHGNWELCEGYDSDLTWVSVSPSDDGKDSEGIFSRDELVEIACHMIGQWTQFLADMEAK